MSTELQDVKSAPTSMAAASASVKGSRKTVWSAASDISLDTFLTRRAGNSESAVFKSVEDSFTNILGDPIPWLAPNIDSSSAATEMAEIERLVPPATTRHSALTCLWATLCSLTGVGGIYVCSKTHLIEQGQLGFAMDSGKPVALRPGWHCLLSPCTQFVESRPVGTSPWRTGALTLVRVPQGHFGIALQNTDLKILLPGTHAYVSGLFRFIEVVSMARPLIEVVYDTIKFVTVPTGFVRICYYNGKALALNPGRYAINSPVCKVGPEVDMRHENVKFSTHQVRKASLAALSLRTADAWYCIRAGHAQRGSQPVM